MESETPTSPKGEAGFQRSVRLAQALAVTSTLMVAVTVGARRI